MHEHQSEGLTQLQIVGIEVLKAYVGTFFKINISNANINIFYQVFGRECVT